MRMGRREGTERPRNLARGSALNGHFMGRRTHQVLVDPQSGRRLDPVLRLSRTGESRGPEDPSWGGVFIIRGPQAD